MPVTSSVGDLSRALALRSANARTRERLAALTQELTTGRHRDLPAALHGDTRRLASVEHRLSLLDTWRRNADEMTGRLAASQRALGAIGDVIAGKGVALAGAGLATDAQLLGAVLADARSNLEAVLGLGNAAFAGQALFAGTRTNAQPLVPADALLAALGTAMAGASDLPGRIAALDAFFDAPPGGGGFIDLAYRGGAQPTGSVAVGPEAEVAPALTAADAPFRETLKGLALAALVADGSLGATAEERQQATQAAGARLMTATDVVTGARAGIGVLEERVEAARTRGEAETASLRIALSGMVSVDPYETAAALTETQATLETLYAITARLSQLSLARRL